MDGPAYDGLVLGREQHPDPAADAAAGERDVVRRDRARWFVVERTAQGDGDRATRGALVGTVGQFEYRVMGEGLAHGDIVPHHTSGSSRRTTPVSHLTAAGIRLPEDRLRRLTHVSGSPRRVAFFMPDVVRTAPVMTDPARRPVIGVPPPIEGSPHVRLHRAPRRAGHRPCRAGHHRADARPGGRRPRRSGRVRRARPRPHRLRQDPGLRPPDPGPAGRSPLASLPPARPDRRTDPRAGQPGRPRPAAGGRRRSASS